MINKCFYIGIAVFFISLSPIASSENALAEILIKVKPSVVVVGTFMPTRNPNAVFLGTGFAVGDGKTVITNAHVVKNDLDATHLERMAIFYRHEQVERMLVAEVDVIDEDHDLAVLSLKEGQLTPLEIGNSEHVREGEEYAFTGYPIGMVLGLYPVTHRSIISAISPNAIPAIATSQLNVNILKKLQKPYDIFQLDATAYPGNSGSPLYDINSGKVIGIINKVFVQGSKENALSNPSGISYAIPAQYISSLLSKKSNKKL